MSLIHLLLEREIFMEITRTIDNREIIIALTPQEIEQTFREKEYEYQSQDLFQVLSEHYDSDDEDIITKNLYSAISIYTKKLSDGLFWEDAAMLAIDTILNKKEELTMNYNMEQIEKNVLGMDDKFEFKCLQCGNCCRNRTDILLMPYDIFRMSKHLQMETIDFFYKYCEVYLGGETKVPIVRLLPKAHNNVCPLLHKGLCRVHEAKPTVCALYPLGRFSSSAKGSETKYFTQNVTCGGKGEFHTLSQWLSKFDVEKSNITFKLWYDFIFSVQGKMKKHHENIKSTAFDNLSKLFLVNIYLKYDTDKEFEEQFERNMSFMKSILGVK